MRGDRRFSRLPSPALKVAIVALTAAIAASAVALPGRNSVNSGDIRNGAVKQSDQAQDQRTEWVLIDLQTQAILKQSGGILIEEGASGLGFATLKLPATVGNRMPAAQTTSSGDPAARAAVCGGPPQGMFCGAGTETRRHVLVSVGTPAATPANVNLTVLPK